MDRPTVAPCVGDRVCLEGRRREGEGVGYRHPPREKRHAPQAKRHCLQGAIWGPPERGGEKCGSTFSCRLTHRSGAQWLSVIKPQNPDGSLRLSHVTWLAISDPGQELQAFTAYFTTGSLSSWNDNEEINDWKKIPRHLVHNLTRLSRSSLQR